MEWVESTLDMSRSVASDLVFGMRWFARFRSIDNRFIEGLASFDRAIATLRLAQAGADPQMVESSEHLDLHDVARLSARQRRMTHRNERRAFAQRLCMAQPTLDESTWRVLGQHPGLEGRTFAKALQNRADEFRQLPGGDEFTRAQRQADALVAMAQDSLDRNGNADAGGLAGPSVAVFVDLDPPTPAAVRPGPRSNMDRGSDPTHSKPCCVPGRCNSSDSPTDDPSSPQTPPGPSHRRFAASWPGVTVAAPSTPVRAATGCNLTIFENIATAAPTTPTTSPRCVGTTTTSPSTAKDSASPSTAHGNGVD